MTEIVAHTFDDLKNLTKLDLIRNQLKKLHPDIFAELGNLGDLHLDINEQKILPEGLIRNNNKSVATNQIKVVHRDLFEELVSLKKLYLDCNEFVTLPEGLFRNNKELERIDLCDSEIKEIHRDLFE